MDSQAKTKSDTDWERSLYVLAEFLHMPVYRIKQEMPLCELIGWCRHFEGKNEQSETDNAKNILKGFGL
jgi:hypothetical protein